MTDRDILFKSLKGDKDNMTECAIKDIQGNGEFYSDDTVNDYEYLRGILKSEVDIEALRKILDETFKWTFEDILSMFDNKGQFNIDLINRDTGKSLGDGISLKEEFKKYLLKK